MDAETLTFLLGGGRISMTERVSRGIWPHPPLRFSEVVSHLALVLESREWFPQEWRPARTGEAIAEGGVIQRISSSEYVYRTQRHHPIDPFLLAEQSEIVFTSARAAAEHYATYDLNLPGKLDGWTVVEPERPSRLSLGTGLFLIFVGFSIIVFLIWRACSAEP